MRTAVCKWCGKTFSYNKGKGTKSYCCKECRRAAQNEAERQRKIANQELERCAQKVNKDVNAELRKMANEAVAHGTTYGKYVAMLEKQKGVITR